MNGVPSSIGGYPVEREIGRGGMGVVYLGRDPRLDRRVAIKVLPETLAADPERLARFAREARLLATLHHSNVAGIYGLEEAAGRRFLVLEYVEGETLAERLARGPMTVEDALETCRQIATALEAAHESGVVHRDLKPANVKLTPSGDVKVLDFGLAKGPAGSSPAADLSQSPTLAPAATMEGVILGTAAYMSPEQARGRSVDKRSDIWAFGCVLYECLTARTAFAGETVSDTIARILQGEPDWSALPPGTSERVRGLLRRCLEKDAKRRLRDIGDAKIEIEDLQSVGSSHSGIVTAPAVHPGGVRRWGREIALGAFAAILGVFATKVADKAIQVGPPDPTKLPSRFEVGEPPDFELDIDAFNMAIAPDGRTLAYLAYDSSGTARIWVRTLDALAARPLPGTEGASPGLFWSPDSRHVGFFTSTDLKKIAVAGGEPEVLAEVKRARGGAWSKKGVILFAPYSNGPLFRVPAAGGEPRQVTVVDSSRGETAHRAPQFLPDGERFLYSTLPAREGKFEIHLASLGAPRGKKIFAAETGVVYGDGYFLFTRGGKLTAQRLGFGLRPRGEPKSLGDVPSGTRMTGAPVVSVSRHGALAYVTSRVPSTELAWLDRKGRILSRVPLEAGPYLLGEVAPDDRHAMIQRVESSDQSDLWLVDLERGVATRTTYDRGNSYGPLYSHDGSRVAYLWENKTPQVVKVKPANAGGAVETYLADDPMFKQLHEWTSDGRYLVYSRQDPATRWDLWLLPMEGDHTPRPFLVTPFNEMGGAVSPDGRWMAYSSDETGTPEVYVQAFPGGGDKYQVTNRAGVLRGWSRDGKQLVYSYRSNLKLGVEADVLPGPSFRLGPPRVLGTTPDNLIGAVAANQSDLILGVLRTGKAAKGAITVLLNWPEALKGR